MMTSGPSDRVPGNLGCSSKYSTIISKPPTVGTLLVEERDSELEVDPWPISLHRVRETLRLAGGPAQIAFSFAVWL